MTSIDTNINKSTISFFEKGDVYSYKVIFNTFYNRLYAFSLNYVEDTYAAEDIVENVFLVLWQKKNDFGKVENLKSYLYSMVRNASIDYLKKEERSVTLDIDKHDTIELLDQHIIEEETHALLYKALDSLPAKCRKVFELSCLEGVKYKDISEELEISINTVKSQRARAIELLKQNLKDYPLFQIFLASL